MGFMDGLLDVLSGPNAVKQIDQQGFDFREKRRQEELARQQQQEQWNQQNEDYNTKAMAEAAVGGMPEDQLGSMLPASLDQNRRRAAINRALGQSAQSKSSLAGQKAQTDYYLQSGKDAASMEREKYKGELRQTLLKQAEEIRANQQMSPREKDAALMKIQAQMQLFGAAEAGRNSRFAQGMGRPQRVQTTDENGDAVWSWIHPGQEAPLAPTAIERQVGGMADTVRQNVDEMGRLAPDVTSGRVAGNISKGSQWMFGPHGKEGEFDFDAKAVIDSVYIKSGKQINATEMGILKQMIPDRGKGNLEEQVRLFGEYANSLLQKYGGAKKGRRNPLQLAAPDSGAGAATPPRPPGVPEGAVFDPVTRRWRL